MIAVVVAFLLPAASWLDGSGLLAFRMYSRAGSYRVHVTNFDENGERIPVAPTAIALLTHGAVRPFLAGADRWSTFPRGDFLADHLSDLATLACRHRSRPARVEVMIERKRSPGGPEERNSFGADCP